MNPTYSVQDLAEIVGGTLRGDGGATIAGIADVSEAGPDQAAWVSNPRYAACVGSSRAGVLLVPADFGPTPMPAIVCQRIEPAIGKLLAAFARPVSQPEPGIHSTAVIHETARIGADAAIGPHVVLDADVSVGASCIIHAGVFIGRGTQVGDECLIWPNVVIRDACLVGNRVTIHPNAVIGADGLGFYFDEGRLHKFPHIGGVQLEDDVEVGACTCIDRAKFGYTVIGRGTKIDNLVQLGHNVRIGEHCVFAGQCGISGSVRIGNHCIFGGNAGTVDNVAIGDGARFAGGVAVATKDIPAGMTVSGYPAQDHRREMRERASVRKLPDLLEQIKNLSARVERLEAAADHPS
jgi:UDP-3-O-[3-hydroxymyristoyl] glucosamine N-acyltransferase